MIEANSTTSAPLGAPNHDLTCNKTDASLSISAVWSAAWSCTYAGPNVIWSENATVSVRSSHPQQCYSASRVTLQTSFVKRDSRTAWHIAMHLALLQETPDSRLSALWRAIHRHTALETKRNTMYLRDVEPKIVERRCCAAQTSLVVSPASRGKPSGKMVLMSDADIRCATSVRHPTTWHHFLGEHAVTRQTPTRNEDRIETLR